MPLHSSVSLKGSQREIIDYMRDVYRIDDIKVIGGGRHLHIEYIYQGRRHRDTLPRSNGGDPNWISTRKHDLRRELGEPPPLLAPRKRSLDEMTQEAQALADLRSGTALGTTVITSKPAAIIVPPAPPDTTPGTGKSPTTAPPIAQRRFPCSIGTVGDHDVAFYLSRELADAMEAAFGKGRRYVVAYKPQYWIARPSRNAGRAVEPGSHRLRCTGTETRTALGRFTSTRAEAVLQHNRVEFRLLDMPVRQYVSEVKTENYTNEPPAETAPPSPPPVQVTTPPAVSVPPPAAPADPRERLLNVLRQIKAIEAEGIYRLIDENGWRWRSIDISLE